MVEKSGLKSGEAIAKTPNFCFVLSFIETERDLRLSEKNPELKFFRVWSFKLSDRIWYV